MILNSQTREVPARSDGSALSVHSIFPTIQGEGLYSGFPAVFIRLAGCNLQCPGCDTEYTRDRQLVTVDRLVEIAENSFPSSTPSLYVITGGEPLRQNIAPLVFALFGRNPGVKVQIETNGTMPPPPGLPMSTKVVCSPKAGRVVPTLVGRINAYKYVLEATNVSPRDGLPTSVLGMLHSPARPHEGFTGPIYLSPMDAQDKETNARNTEAAVRSCMKYGYILNLQIHKLVGLP